MLNLKKIAVTGMLSAGKTSVCDLFKQHHAYVVNADSIVHKLLENNPKIKEKIIHEFGPGILSDGDVDRKKLASLVFNDGNKLNILEKIIHPAVFNEIIQHYEQANKDRRYGLFVAEIPLLFKTGFETFFDKVVIVQASDDLCKSRFMNKTGYGSEEWEKRMTYQLSSVSNKSKDPFVINNNGSFETLKTQVDQIVNVLSKGASR